MSRLDTMIATAAVTVLIALLTPVLAAIGDASRGEGSLNNLRQLHRVNTCYASDWNDRQWTACRDDLGEYHGNCDTFRDGTGVEHPPTMAGFGCSGAAYAFWYGSGADCRVSYPVSFDSPDVIGSYLMPNFQGLHDYIDSDKFYDPVYYMPDEPLAQEALGPAFESDCEFHDTIPGVNWVPAGYVFSPAAMWHPDVLRPVAEGGWCDPVNGPETHLFESPSVSQVRFPDLKTRMIEHWWVRDAPGPCNPGLDGPALFYDEKCTPYMFNHGADAKPLAMFFDGSIERLWTASVVADDAQVLEETGGVDGLWSRDTPFGAVGYYGDFSVDGTLVSHHMLTTGGILGRDRLGER